MIDIYVVMQNEIPTIVFYTLEAAMKYIEYQPTKTRGGMVLVWKVHKLPLGEG